MALPWSEARVYHARQNHGIVTGCPTIPKDRTPRGDGLVPLSVAADMLGVVRTALGHWQKWGFLQVEQRGAGSPLWVRLSAEEIARLDGTLAGQGFGQWRIREAEQVLGVTKEQPREKARQGS